MDLELHLIRLALSRIWPALLGLLLHRHGIPRAVAAFAPEEGEEEEEEREHDGAELTEKIFSGVLRATRASFWLAKLVSPALIPGEFLADTAVEVRRDSSASLSLWSKPKGSRFLAPSRLLCAHFATPFF